MTPLKSRAVRDASGWQEELRNALRKGHPLLVMASLAAFF